MIRKLTCIKSNAGQVKVNLNQSGIFSVDKQILVENFKLSTTTNPRRSSHTHNQD